MQKKVRKNFTEALLSAAGKAKVAMYNPQKATIKGSELAELNNQQMTLEKQMQQQFIRNVGKN